MMFDSLNNWHVIGAMALTTVFVRLIGFYIMSKVPFTPFVKAALEALPGAILVSTIVPIAIKTGLVAIIGVTTSIITMYFLRRDYFALIAGLGVVILLRAYGF